LELWRTDQARGDVEDRGLTTRCRSCDGSNVRLVIDLGETPLANALRTGKDFERPEARYPLAVVFCDDCTLVQITETVPPEQLFSEYVYLSSVSDTTVRSAGALVDRLVRSRELGAGALAMEAASNDGYLLRHYRDRGIPVLGIEPARNIAEIAERAGVPTRRAFFGIDEARRLAAEGLRADVFHANNVLAHVPDLNGFVAGIRTVLKDDGLAIIEVHYVRDLVEQLEFDTIYHEHLCYYSITALQRLLSRNGLAIVEVERLPIHGGSLRVLAAPGHGTGPGVTDHLAEEQRLGMDRHGFYADFARRVGQLKTELRATLQDLKRRGARLAAYGASAKGAILLEVTGIGEELLDFVVDRNPIKQGRFMPGTRLPILRPETLLTARPDYVLLLTWNFAEEILAQQAEFRAGGGKFVLPVPAVRIV